jgi:exonuclease III
VRRLQLSGIPLDIIVLQETWEIKFPELLIIPGFQKIVSRTREGMRGGGVGIYIRNGLNFNERKDLENYSQKTFENVTIEVLYPNRNIIISNIYRSPNPPPNMTPSEHSDYFLDTLDSHLARLSELNRPSYIFTDSKINLLQLGNSTPTRQFSHLL